MLGRPVLKIAGIAPLFLTLLSTSAMASVTQVGFQWVSPTDGSGQGQLPVVQIPAPSAAPVVQVTSPQSMQSPEVISPVVIDGTRSQPSSSQYNQQPYNVAQPSSGSTYASPSYSGPTYTGMSQSPSSTVISSSYGQINNGAPSSMPVVPSGTAPVIVSSGSQPSSGPTAPGGTAAVMVGGNGAGYGNDTGNAVTAPVVGGAPAQSEYTPVYSGNVISTSPSLVSAAPPVVSAAPAVAGDTVQGFANQVPLAVALRQLLPPGYGFSIDPTVDLGTLVSFHGGRPWRDTLRDSLDPAGLAMHEQDQMVTITHAGNGMGMASPPPAMTGSSLPVLSPPQPAPLPVLSSNNQMQYLQPPVTVNPLPLPVSAPVLNTPVTQSWNADRGDTLHKILEDWSRRANVEFEWLAEYDYPLQASFTFNGTFEEAVRNLLTGFEGAHPQPIAELHTNPSMGQMVLIIETRGNNYSD
jgi:hypothetical protein